MREVLNRLGNDAGRVQVIFLQLDHQRDTWVLREYVRDAHPSFVGLRGDEATTSGSGQGFQGVLRQTRPAALPAPTASTTPQAAMPMTPRAGCGF